MTFAQLANQTATSPDALRVRLARAKQAGTVSASVKFAQDAECPADVAEILTGTTRKVRRGNGPAHDKVDQIFGTPGGQAVKRSPQSKKETRQKNEHSEHSEQPAREQANEQSEQVANTQSKTNNAQPYTVALYVAVQLIPVINTFRVCSDMAGSWEAVLFTVCVTGVPMLLLFTGKHGVFYAGLTWCFIGFEIFANAARIFEGLTNGMSTRNPSRFLGLVTDFLNTGSYSTAVALSLIFAWLVAWAQVALIKALK